ncbi:MAG TPA: RelA/SpoT family protein [Candidatus Woesebacteria bacterium]|nr:RelA/SpoT family protein [Candidatus Woesebacteria bacterium]
MIVSFEDLLVQLGSKRKDIKSDRLKQVYLFAAEKHSGQNRDSGEPYISHPLSVAYILASWGLDQPSVEAALLHDLLEYTDVKIDEIRHRYGDEVADLVEGVDRVSKVKLKGSQNAEFLENLRKMFVAMAQDIRVVLIRLADRLHNISTLEAIPISKQKRIAVETLEVYAPLAERLGMGRLKGDLEDLSFPYIFPEEYQWLKEVAKPHLKYSENNVREIMKKIRQQLVKHGISAKVEGRPKRMYSLYRKLLRPEFGRDITKIYDLMAIRIITKDLPSCYSALGVIHQYWKPCPQYSISDFIAQPKPNGYQSIHTKIFDNKGNIVEVQIRSEEMHLTAEYGAAAHFAYSDAKSHGASDADLEAGVAFKISQKMSWIKQLAGWQQQVLSPSESLEEYKLDALSHHIYVFSPKGDVYDLPENSTPVDYAFNVHSDLGYYIQTVIVNGKIVPLDYQLKSGDIIEIQKSKTARCPNRNWLSFVKTHRAKEKIRKDLQGNS